MATEAKAVEGVRDSICSLLTVNVLEWPVLQPQTDSFAGFIRTYSAGTWNCCWTLLQTVIQGITSDKWLFEQLSSKATYSGQFQLGMLSRDLSWTEAKLKTSLLMCDALTDPQVSSISETNETKLQPLNPFERPWGMTKGRFPISLKQFAPFHLLSILYDIGSDGKRHRCHPISFEQNGFKIHTDKCFFGALRETSNLPLSSQCFSYLARGKCCLRSSLIEKWPLISQSGKCNQSFVVISCGQKRFKSPLFGVLMPHLLQLNPHTTRLSTRLPPW